MASAVDVEGVGVIYKTAGGELVHALQEVSFDVKEKEFVSVIGPSGCGKSTVLKVVGGLIRQTAGKVGVEGETPVEARKKAKFGFVFQNPVLLPWRTSLSNTILPLEILRRQEKRRETALDLLKLVGLEGFEDKYPRELSGGMQQRVAIARALIFAPPILLMDEPFGALDEITRDKMNLDLLRIWAEAGKTVIFVTHSIPEAAFLSNRVVVFSNRPAVVKTVINVDLPYPRTLETKETPEYVALVRKIRLALGIT